MTETGITLEFADGSYRFALLLPQVIELERLAGKSVFQIYDEMSQCLGLDADGNAVFAGGAGPNAKAVVDTIRLGLIGGNSAMINGEEKLVGPQMALALCNAYAFPARPLAEGVAQAWAVLNAAIRGIEVKKKPVAAPSKSGTKRSAKAS